MRLRSCRVLRGTPETTAADAATLVANLPVEDVLWIGPDHTPSRAVRALLGQSFDAVILDLHAGIDADVLGQCQGFIRGGGALIMRLPSAGIPGEDPRLAAYPYTPADVTNRFARRVEARLPQKADLTPLEPADRAQGGTAEQAAVVATLQALLAKEVPQAAVLVADRGRGKSSALGLVLCHFHGRALVVAGRRDAAAEVFAFGGDRPFVEPMQLALAAAECDVIIIDEAAQIPVPVLQRIVTHHPGAHLIFATTARGYEGTGRGFVLRFVEWLAARRSVQRLHLTAPIRWAENDPLEQLIFDALLLDAQPGEVNSDALVRAERLDRQRLNDADLRQFFGLMIHAHYRTTPGDLHRMLDAPNVHLHVLRAGDAIVAATLVALEGSLPPDVADAIHWGRTRVRGHALPETLASHAGRPDAAQMKVVRSVRIAVHPDWRRRGLGTRLIEHVHAQYDPDYFGTLFGATPGLLAFRRANGYRLVRLGASRGTRTGEPAAVMLRPVRAPARALLADLRADLARDLPLQLELMQAGQELLLDADMRAAVLHDLPPPAPLDPQTRDAIVRTFTHGPRTHEAAAVAIEAYVRVHADRLDVLPAQTAELLRARVLERASWADVMRRAQTPSIPATMRALRRALRAFAEVC